MCKGRGEWQVLDYADYGCKECDCKINLTECNLDGKPIGCWEGGQCNYKDSYDISITDDGLIPGSLPIANFSAIPLTGTAPLTVTFTDQSIGGPENWAWAFGDGGTSLERHPLYTYILPGVYTVTLTTSNAQGSDSVSRTSYIVTTEVKQPTYLPLIIKDSQ